MKSLLFLILSSFALLTAGCAGLGEQTREAGGDSRLERLVQGQQRLEMRIDEVTRQVLALRERADAQEAALKALSSPTPPATALPSPSDVKVEPLAPEPPARVQESAPAPVTREAPPPPDAGAELYRKAYGRFRDGRYGPAILDFEEFLRKYPDHQYADSAQYWIGESYYLQGEYAQSAVEFNRVLERYPKGTKAPDALLKIGLCYAKAGDRDKALVFWKRLVSQHPDSEAAHQAKTMMEK